MFKKSQVYIIILFISFLNAYEIGIIKPDRKMNESFLKISNDVLSSHFKDASFYVNMKLYNTKVGVEKFDKNELDWASLAPSIFFDNEEMFLNKLKNIWLVPLNSKRFHQFYLITNKDNKNIFKNLDKYKFYLPELYEGSHFYFKSLLFKRFKSKAKKYFSKFKMKNKESKILYDIFFKKNILGLIPKASYDIVVELNPQIKKRVKILAKSQASYLPFFIISHKKMTDKEEKEILDFIRNKKSVVFDNSQLILGSLVEPLEKIAFKDLKNLRKLYIEYKLLQKKYK